MLYFRKAKTLYDFPLSNSWLNQKAKQHKRDIPQSFYKLGTE